MHNLLRRTPHKIDHARVGKWLDGKRVMITGAGGTIGSEIARTCAGFDPKDMLLLDRDEHSLFLIEQELRNTNAVLCDATSIAGVTDLADSFRPHIVFHAAAYKHVPMMERHIERAIENNFAATKIVADAARNCGAETFVFISTDKAVNPTSVMGMTKRLAECYVKQASADGAFCSVRFGNVLASSGSVLETWQRQVAAGEPITLTDPDMTRYFMTVHEAAGLVIQAGMISQGGETFVLDMGEPIRMGDLADRFLQQAGSDTKPVVTGRRPGEKDHERLVEDGSRLVATSVPGIMQVEVMHEDSVSGTLRLR